MAPSPSHSLAPGQLAASFVATDSISGASGRAAPSTQLDNGGGGLPECKQGFSPLNTRLKIVAKAIPKVSVGETVLAP